MDRREERPSPVYQLTKSTDLIPSILASCLLLHHGYFFLALSSPVLRLPYSDLNIWLLWCLEHNSPLPPPTFGGLEPSL